jgi:hypothetical protein
MQRAQIQSGLLRLEFKLENFGYEATSNVFAHDLRT